MSKPSDMRPALRRWRWIIPIVALAVVLAGALAFLATQAKVAQEPPPRGMAALGRNVDDVALIGATGKAVTWGGLKGTPRALFFGFTSCPEICPTTIADLSSAMERIGPSARVLRVDFVSVDPARDTADALAAYLDAFGPQFAGYTGKETEIARLTAAYRAAYRRVPLDGDDYTMDHTTAVYLIDAGGEVRDVVSYQTPPEQLDAQLKAFLGE